MDTCVSANLATYSVGLLFCILSIVDAARREVPAIVVKIRVSGTLWFILSVVQWAIYSTSSNVTYRVIDLLGQAVLWTWCLYILENFVSIFLGLEYKSAQDLSSVMACWKYARVLLTGAFLTLAIISPFEPTFRLSIASDVVLFVCMCLVILPVAVTLLRLAWALKGHISGVETPDESAAENTSSSEKSGPTQKQLKVVALQVSAYGTLILALACWGIVAMPIRIIGLSSKPHVEYEKPSCSYRLAIYYVVSTSIVLFITRAPGSRLRHDHNTSETQGRSSSPHGSPRHASTLSATTVADVDQAPLELDQAPLELEQEPLELEQAPLELDLQTKPTHADV